MPKIAVELSDKEAEAIVWLTAHLIDFAHADDTQLEDDHIVRRLRMHGYSNVQIQEEGEALEDFAAKRILPPALTAIQSEALKDAVEKTTWIQCYAEDTLNLSGREGLAEALKALRDLAEKLEQRGVEITHLTYGEYSGT